MWLKLKLTHSQLDLSHLSHQRNRVNPHFGKSRPPNSLPLYPNWMPIDLHRPKQDIHFLIFFLSPSTPSFLLCFVPYHHPRSFATGDSCLPTSLPRLFLVPGFRRPREGALSFFRLWDVAQMASPCVNLLLSFYLYLCVCVCVFVYNQEAVVVQHRTMPCGMLNYHILRLNWGAPSYVNDSLSLTSRDAEKDDRCRAPPVRINSEQEKHQFAYNNQFVHNLDLIEFRDFAWSHGG